MVDVVGGNGHKEDMVEIPASALPPLPSLDTLHTVEQFRTAASILMNRWQFLNQAGITFDGKRDTYTIFGYQRQLTSKDYRDRYQRGGIAGRIVDVLPDATWRGTVEVREDKDSKTDTPFEKAWKDLDRQFQLQAKLLRVDKLSRLSNYAVLLIGALGELNTELPKVSAASVGKLLYFTPFLGGGGPGADGRSRSTSFDSDATIKDFDVEPKSPRFGSPSIYTLRRVDIASPDAMKEVHWSRILHVAEGVLDNDVYGMPALERVWNLLDDLDKVTGGGSEAFWLRANAGLHLDVDKDMAFPPVKAGEESELDRLKRQAEDYAHQMTRMMRTKGVTVSQLGSDVANFNSPADAILTQIAGAKAMPKRILTGSEMGELASSQDRDNWKDQINGRQTGYAGPYILRALLDRLIEFGYLPTPSKGIDQYDIVWPHIQTLTEDEKASGASKWASVNQAAGVTVFTAEEIRDKWYSMGPGDDDDTELWKAELALKMATVNKTEGAVIFTDDEIRKTCYNWAPLTPEQKIPITAPERVSATAPTPEVDAQGKPVIAAKPVVPALKAAEEGDEELLEVLEAAIKAGNEDVVLKIVGLRE